MPRARNRRAVRPARVQQALARSPKARLQSPLSGRPRARILFPETLLDVDFAQPVYVLVDRLAIAPDIRSRLADSIEICYREGKGEAILNSLPSDAARLPRPSASSSANASSAKLRPRLSGA